MPVVPMRSDYGEAHDDGIRTGGGPGDRGQPRDRQGHRRPSGPGRVRRGHRGPHRPRGGGPRALVHRGRLQHHPAAGLPRHHGGAGRGRRATGPSRLPRPARPHLAGLGRGHRARAVGPDRRAGQQRALRRSRSHGPGPRHAGRTAGPAPRGQCHGPGGAGQARAALDGRPGERRGHQSGLELGHHGSAEAGRQRRMGPRLRHVQRRPPPGGRHGGRRARPTRASWPST